MNTILEIGPINPDLPIIFPLKQVLNLQQSEISKLSRFLKRKDLFFVSINSGPFNGNTVKIIRDIRKEYSGLLIVFVASNDCQFCKKFLEAGASDVVFHADINKNTIEKIVERYQIRNYAQDTLNEIRTGLSKIPKL